MCVCVCVCVCPLTCSQNPSKPLIVLRGVARVVIEAGPAVTYTDAGVNITDDFVRCVCLSELFIDSLACHHSRLFVYLSGSGCLHACLRLFVFLFVCIPVRLFVCHALTHTHMHTSVRVAVLNVLDRAPLTHTHTHTRTF